MYLLPINVKLALHLVLLVQALQPSVKVASVGISYTKILACLVAPVEAPLTSEATAQTVTPTALLVQEQLIPVLLAVMECIWKTQSVSIRAQEDILRLGLLALLVRLDASLVPGQLITVPSVTPISIFSITAAIQVVLKTMWLALASVLRLWMEIATQTALRTFSPMMTATKFVM